MTGSELEQANYYTCGNQLHSDLDVVHSIIGRGGARPTDAAARVCAGWPRAPRASAPRQGRAAQRRLQVSFSAEKEKVNGLAAEAAACGRQARAARARLRWGSVRRAGVFVDGGGTHFERELGG